MASFLPTLPIPRTSRRPCLCLSSNNTNGDLVVITKYQSSRDSTPAKKTTLSIFGKKERKKPYLSISIVKIQELGTFHPSEKSKKVLDSGIPAVHSSSVPLRSWIPVESVSAHLVFFWPSSMLLNKTFFPNWRKCPTSVYLSCDGYDCCGRSLVSMRKLNEALSWKPGILTFWKRCRLYWPKS